MVTPLAVDELWMGRAIEFAQQAVQLGERPFGCVIIREGAVGGWVGTGTGSASRTDPTRHSELEAIRMACQAMGGHLEGCVLYSTFEPCAMCCGAISHAKLSRVVYGAFRADIGLRHRHLTAARLLLDTTHPPEVLGGVLRAKCVELMQPERESRLGY